MLDAKATLELIRLVRDTAQELAPGLTAEQVLQKIPRLIVAPHSRMLAFGSLGAGIAIGAGIGLLFATKPGAQLRRDIAERGKRLLGRSSKASGPNGDPYEMAQPEAHATVEPSPDIN